MRKVKAKKLPRFKSEKQEREFWLKHDSADFFDLNQARLAMFPNLKPTTRAISIRLPQSLLARLKVLANKRDIPYQSLVKVFLSERVEKEMRAR